MPIFILLIAIVFGLIGSSMAKKRGRDAVGWFVICFLFPIIGLIILAAVGDAKKEQTVPDSGSPNTRAITVDQSAKWRSLVELDADVAAAAEKAREYGPEYEKLLAEKFLPLSDKTYLQAALNKVIEAARLDELSPETEARQEAKAYLDKLPHKIDADGCYVLTKGALIGRRFSSAVEFVEFARRYARP